MKPFGKRMLSLLKRAFKKATQRVRVWCKALRNRINRDRVSRTRWAYLGLSVGTVALAYLLVLINSGIFALTERGLYDRERYEAIDIISAGAIGEPLSRTVRVALYRDCTIEGEERATLPEERSKESAEQQVRLLWEQMLADYGSGGYLRTGESVERILQSSKYSVRLRDFYSERTGAKLAVWGAQAYCSAAGGRVYCLSAELDSRTEDVYSITLALFENIDGSDPATDFMPMLTALGESVSTDGLIVSRTEYGSLTTLPLTDGVKLYRYTYPGSQIYLTLG